MRIFSIILSAALIVLSLCGCGLFDEVYVTARAIPWGYSSREEMLDPAHKEFLAQDFNDYCKYYYEDDSAVRSIPFYRVAGESDVQTILGYFDDFEGWVRACEQLAAYDFDKKCVTPGDLFFIKTLEGKPIGDDRYEKFDNYSVYLFDVETNTLYYIHANI